MWDQFLSKFGQNSSGAKVYVGPSPQISSGAMALWPPPIPPQMGDRYQCKDPEYKKFHRPGAVRETRYAAADLCAAPFWEMKDM